MKKLWQNPEYHQEQSRKISLATRGENNSMYGRKHTEDTKQKIREGHEGVSLTEEHKRKIKKYYDDPIIKDAHVRKILKASSTSPNKQEKLLSSFLNKILPAEYDFVGNGGFILAGKCPDFKNMNGKKKLIELYGDYYHNGQKSQDRINLFKKYEYETLIIWGHELKDLDQLKNKVLEFNFA